MNQRKQNDQRTYSAADPPGLELSALRSTEALREAHCYHDGQLHFTSQKYIEREPVSAYRLEKLSELGRHHDAVRCVVLRLRQRHVVIIVVGHEET